MSAIPELPKPGVKVIQEYTAAAPVVVVPSLVPCIIGACYEIHELEDDDGTLNSDIIVSGPAIALSPNDETAYTAMSGKILKLRVNGGVEQSFTMPATATLTAQQVASAINGASPAPQGFAAYVYEDASAKKYLELRTLSSGAGQNIQITGGDMLDNPLVNLGFATGWTYYGLGSYVQDAVYLKQSSFPDPRGNLEELDILEETIRAFLDLGTETREILQTESFLRRDSYYDAGPPEHYGVEAYDDGDGDQTTPYLDLRDSTGAAPNLQGSAGPANVTSDGNVDFTADTIDVHGKTLILQLDGGGKQTITLVGDPVVSNDSTGWTFAHDSELTVAVNGVSATLAMAGADLPACITALNVSSQAAFGIDIAFRADQYGNAAPAGTYMGLVYGGDPTADAAASPLYKVEVTATGGTDNNEVFTDASMPYHQVLQANGNGPRDPAWTQINTLILDPSPFAALVGTDLYLEAGTSGSESKIEIDSLSTALGTALLDLTAGVYTGAPFTTRVGDYIYGDGALLGMIVEVEPGGTQGRVKVDTEQPLTLTKTAWYIIAKNLDAVPSSAYGNTVPTPDLFIDTNGDVHVKHDFLRDTSGAPVGTSQNTIYLMYNALRLDVSGSAAEPSLLSFDNVDDLEDALGPINADNPLAYGLFVAMSNAPAIRVYGIGVDDVSADKPYGTLEGFTSALDFLESKEVYALATMTSDLDVATVLQTHVNAMSAPDQKAERIGIFHLGTPTRKMDEIVASGNDGDTSNTNEFDTKIATLSAALLDAEIDPSSIDISDEVYLDLAEDSYNWNITGSITDGTKVSINKTFAAGENDDAFFEESATFPTVVSGSFSVKVRGATIATKGEEVETVYGRGQSFADRRMWMMQLDTLYATIGGITQEIPGFFMGAAKAGMVGGLNPALPMTNRAIAVFTAVTGTNDRYSTAQLNQMAAGGADLIVQETDGAALTSRMQVTTKMTSIAEREQSIVKAVDYCAKFYRTSLRKYIGSYNITQSFLDTLSSIIEGLSRWLVEEGKVVAGANMSNLLQDEDQPDTVLADVSLTVLYPANYIQITLLV